MKFLMCSGGTYQGTVKGTPEGPLDIYIKVDDHILLKGYKHM